MESERQRALLDLLKEVANIGTGFAATALSQFINRQVKMTVPTARVLLPSELPKQLGGEDTHVAAVYAPLNGEVQGGIFFVTALNEAKGLADLLLDLYAHGSAKIPEDPLSVSAFQEVANIVIGAYLSSLADLTALMVAPQVTALTFDMAGAVLAEGTLLMAEEDEVILIETVMALEGRKQTVQGFLLLLPDRASLLRIEASLKGQRDG
ncbi:chemotaxis protein CheC [Shouchella shacheensis]|uniref:chemotaxis protein CheC n=1 Tax=Shouchella shacheensis TaxID=1649580 RepID=UPI0007402C18|nr:chemotaxis protein CheC [Shouchella shacheensis]